jgi:hypothetical protein
MLVILPLLLSAAPLAPPTERPPVEDVAWLARRRLVAASRGDPDIGDVQGAAARCADPLAAERGAVSRARTAALLPSVTAELRIDDKSYRVVGQQASGEVDYSRVAPGWSASLRATWDLAGLVSPQSGRLTARGLLESAQRRDQAVKGVTAVYFERRRRRLALEAAPPSDPAERAVAELEVERLGAELDALTCGAFAVR